MQIVKKRLVFALFVMLFFLPLSSATELGVNYYHESMMSDQWKLPYIQVDLAKASTDFDNIKTIASHVKFYMNPFVEGNFERVISLSKLAKQKGMNVIIVMNVEDRVLSNSNWDAYSSKVIYYCSNLSGKVDGFIVGNEVSLHTDLEGSEIQKRLVSLINSCKSKFVGEVSYEAFWYEKDYWKNYQEPIYFNLYENIDQFKYNVKEMDKLFGSKAYIGEWGVSLLNQNIEYDDWWQKDQIRQRWEIIKETSSPVAYIFSYREPSWNGFGIVRPDEVKRPLWDLFTQEQFSNITIQPQTSDSSLLNSLIASCSYNTHTNCTKNKDYTSGSCRTISFATSSGPIDMLACIKSGGIELYRNNYPENIEFSACLGSSCINEIAGFTLVSYTSNPSSVPVVSSKSFSIDKLVTSCNVEGKSCSIKSDTMSGSCRNLVFGSSGGDIKIQGCDKGDGFVELYLQKASLGKYKICLANGCVDELSGFNRFQPDTNVKIIESKPKVLNVSSLSVNVNPSGKVVGDHIETTGCRKVQFESSAGWLESRICPKSDKYEMYFLSGTAHASICVGSSCVNSASGFASFT